MIEVLGHRVLIKPKDLEKKSAGGIIIEYADQEKAHRMATQEGTVVQIGPSAWQVEALGGEPWCNPGDDVIFAKYAGKLVKDPEDGAEYFVVNDEDIQCRTKRAH